MLFKIQDFKITTTTTNNTQIQQRQQTSYIIT